MERTLPEEVIPLETYYGPVSHNTQPSPTSADNIYCRAFGSEESWSCPCLRLKGLELRFWHPYSTQEKESVELLYTRVIEARKRNRVPLGIRIWWKFKSDVKHKVNLT